MKPIPLLDALYSALLQSHSPVRLARFSALTALTLLLGCGGEATGSDSESVDSPSEEGVDRDGDGIIDGDEEFDALGNVTLNTPQSAEEYRSYLERGWSVEKELPADGRPPVKGWTPAIELSEPGWSESTVPFCQPFVAAQLIGLASDERGVFAAVSRYCGNVLAGETCDPEGGGALFQNDGKGWALVTSPGVNLEKMTATGSGAFLFGLDVLFDLEAGVKVLEHPFLSRQSSIAARAGVVIASDLAPEAGAKSLVAKFNLKESLWQPEPIQRNGYVAVDTQGSYYLASADSLTRVTEGVATAIADVPAGEYGGGGIWAESADNIWAIETGGDFVHCDGGGCHVDFKSAGLSSSAFQFGSVGGRLYFISRQTMGFIEGHTVTTVVPQTADWEFSYLATGGDGGVFVAAYSPALDAFSCGGHMILWFDGEEFHRF